MNGYELVKTNMGVGIAIGAGSCEKCKETTTITITQPTTITVAEITTTIHERDPASYQDGFWHGAVAIVACIAIAAVVLRWLQRRRK